MDKKVIFNGIEILTNEADSSALSLLGFVESVIDYLESDLDRVDENFHLSINIDFTPDNPTTHTYTCIGGICCFICFICIYWNLPQMFQVISLSPLARAVPHLRGLHGGEVPLLRAALTDSAQESLRWRQVPSGDAPDPQTPVDARGHLRVALATGLSVPYGSPQRA